VCATVKKPKKKWKEKKKQCERAISERAWSNGGTCMLQVQLIMNYSDPVCRALKQARVFSDSEGAKVTSIDISADASQIVTSSEDAALRLYDAQETGTIIKTLYAKKYGVSHVRFCHAPGTVVCASRNEWDNSLRYWSLYDNRYLRYFKGHRAEVVGLSVSPKDDYILSASADGTCRLWDVRSDACAGFLRLPNNEVRPLIAFDDTGIVFAVAAPSCNGRGTTIKLFSAADHDLGPFATNLIPNENASYATSIKFSSDGKFLLLSGGSNACFLIDSLNECRVVCEYRLSPSASGEIITDAAMTPDLKYVIAGTSGTSDSGGSIHIWRSGQ
jgi:COMPASS component SWD2